MTHTLTRDFAALLIDWHAHQGRHSLPWQNARDPYRIWLSEIMLQQTQVNTVIPYYKRFLESFPDVIRLADAPLEEVLGLWSGLGYYARARNLHRAAQTIAEQHGGRFPPDAAGLETLPGIGRSTAAAIAAFAYGERAAILDGNVRRVLCRAFGIEGFPGRTQVEKQLWSLAETLLPQKNIATYTQAQMDLGATLCTRSRPDCKQCPLSEYCVAYQDDRIAELPTPRPRKRPPLRQVRVAVITSGAHVLMEQRPPTGIWGGLLALPEIPEHVADAQAWLEEKLGLTLVARGALADIHHAFTHFKLQMQPLRFDTRDVATQAGEEDHYVWLARNASDRARLPTPARKLLQTLAEPDLFEH